MSADRGRRRQVSPLALQRAKGFAHGRRHRRELRALKAENRPLRQRIERLEEALSDSKRQATPFSRSRKDKPHKPKQSPGRNKGRGSFRRQEPPPEKKEGRSTWRYEKRTFETLDATYERGRQALDGSPDRLARQERLGPERMLIYKTMVLTGLRLGELASIAVGRLHLDAPQPHAELLARDAKAGQRALIPLRADLVKDLRGWLDEKLKALRVEAEKTGDPLPLRLPLEEPLFSVPRNLIKSFNLDLAAADIPKDDERGRTVDLHALRHTFGTHLSKNGVAPRTAQAALRHSSLDLTMNVYTDPQLLDVAGAMEALPVLAPDMGSLTTAEIGHPAHEVPR